MSPDDTLGYPQTLSCSEILVCGKVMARTASRSVLAHNDAAVSASSDEGFGRAVNERNAMRAQLENC